MLLTWRIDKKCFCLNWVNKLKIWKSFTVSSEKLEVGVKQIVASISLEGKLCSVILFWLKLVNILPPSDDAVNWDRICKYFATKWWCCKLGQNCKWTKHGWNQIFWRAIVFFLGGRRTRISCKHWYVIWNSEITRFYFIFEM